MDSGPAPHRPAPSWRLELAALALFVALAVVHTWPLAKAPGTYCRNDNSDTVLNEWALAWVAHAIATDPLHLFDANIFHPEKRTLAFSEHMLPQALMVAPVQWLGGSPVLAYSLALLAGFALTGWAFSHLVYRWTGSWGAGLIAGSLAAFNTHSFTRFGHLQALHLEFLPLALLALDRVLTMPRLRHALALAWWTALQSLTSGYFLVFTVVSLVASVAVRPREWLLGERRRAAEGAKVSSRLSPTRVLAALALAAIVASLLLLPFIWPYVQVRRELGLVRPLQDVARYSAQFTDYLLTGATPHWGWSQRFWPGTALFPGVLGIALAVTSLVSLQAFRDRRARMCLAIALVTFVLSFGVRFPLYPSLYQALPLFHAIRAVSRFGQFTLLALAVLGGFGAAWWLARIRRPWVRGVVAAALLAVVQVESWHAPIWYTEFKELPRVHRTLAGQQGVVAYFPFHTGGDQPRNAEHMLASTLNWLPMLNGFSGFAPPSFFRHAEHLAGFPDTASIDYLRRTGVRFVVVDTRGYREDEAQAIDNAPSLRRWAADETYRIYDIGR